MRKEVKTYWDGQSTWRLNSKTSILSCERDGILEYPTGDNAEKVRRIFVNRARATQSRQAKHEALTSLGLVRVRGAWRGVYYE